ncbi:MAG: protein kinase [Anaerolineae bacterium]
MPDLVGQTFDIYRIDRLLGQGTVASVYEATDLRTSDTVALKIIYPQLSAQDSYQKSFLAMMRVMLGMQHPNILRIYNADLKYQQLFIAMEYIPGGSLRDFIVRQAQERKLPPLKIVVRYMSEVADALHYAHDQRVLHQDIKPDNILFKPLDKGQFQMVLTDLGMKQVVGGALNSEVVPPEGTLPYMSPELCSGHPGDARSDLYSLGVILYYLSVGRLPFAPRALQEAVEMHTRAPVPRPISLRPSMPPELEQIILKCLEKPPSRRYQSAAELSRALHKLQFQLEHQFPTEAGVAQDYSDTLDAHQTMAVPQTRFTEPAIAPEQFGRDRLVISGTGSPTRTMLFNKDVLLIGRDLSADIILDENLISRYHARIERLPDGYYQVTDLDSRNGSWLGTTQLKPNEPRIWQPGEVLRLGTFRLLVQGANNLMLTSPGVFAQNTLMGAAAHEEFVSPDAPLVERTPLKLAVTLSPEVVSTAPGTPQTVKMTILNQTGRVDHFQVQVRGVPREWFTVPDVSTDMLPDASDAVSIVFNPPKNSSSVAGLYPYEIVLTSVGQPNTAPLVIPGQLRVEPFYGFTSDIEPSKVRVRAVLSLRVVNAGNTPQTFTTLMRDREGELNLSFSPDVFTLNPGQSQQVTINCAPRMRALFGSTERYSFDADVSDGRADSQPQSQRVEVTVPPVFAAWAITSFVAFIFVCAGLSACVITQLSAWNTERVQTENAQATAAVQAAATATAQSDVDGDGLTLAEERILGTTPEDADTDADGLTDWQETRQFGTNPKARDTDNDTLADGVEINNPCLSPLNPDTDGDGIRDNADGNPCFPDVPVPAP